MADFEYAARTVRNIDPRLGRLAAKDASIRHLLDTATDPAQPESDRRDAVRLLQAFLVLTPLAADGWVSEHDGDEANPVWRRPPAYAAAASHL